MSRIVVFGAGGTAGRKVVAEARERGHDVVAVVRDPGRHQDLTGTTRGDVTDAGSVAAVVAGADAVVSAVYRADVDPGEFYTAAATALVAGLTAAGVTRLVVVGIGTVLEVAPGVAVHDTPGFPAEHRAFSVGHAAEIAVLEGSDTALDWLVAVPPPVLLDAQAPRTGRYRTGGTAVITPAADTFSYADLAVALVDEAENPRHHRTLMAVAQ